RYEVTQGREKQPEQHGDDERSGRNFDRDPGGQDQRRRELEHMGEVRHHAAFCRVTWRRNWRSRSVRGSPSTATGSPCSTISPSFMKRMRLATSRAKRISCVTRTIDRPSSANSW